MLDYNWKPGEEYILLVDSNAVQDTLGRALAKNDTLRLTARTEESYGSVALRFQNLNLARKPLIQFIQNNEVVISFPVRTAEWRNRIFPPGEYEMRILYDDNENGTWDTGNYRQNRQPETALPIEQKLTVRANWDNERDIIL